MPASKSINPPFERVAVWERPAAGFFPAILIFLLFDKGRKGLAILDVEFTACYLSIGAPINSYNRSERLCDLFRILL
jgi:hypothetical protein